MESAFKLSNGSARKTHAHTNTQRIRAHIFVAYIHTPYVFAMRARAITTRSRNPTENGAESAHRMIFIIILHTRTRFILKNTAEVYTNRTSAERACVRRTKGESLNNTDRYMHGRASETKRSVRTRGARAHRACVRVGHGFRCARSCAHTSIKIRSAVREHAACLCVCLCTSFGCVNKMNARLYVYMCVCVYKCT